MTGNQPIRLMNSWDVTDGLIGIWWQDRENHFNMVMVDDSPGSITAGCPTYSMALLAQKTMVSEFAKHLTSLLRKHA